MKFNRLMLGILAIVAIGCGGGGGGSSVPGGGGNTTLSIFASDSLSTDYDHVWVKIHRVSVGDRQVFNSATGKVLDLKTLRDATGARFAFLDDSSLPAGGYDDVKVDLDKELTLVPVGTTTGQIRQIFGRLRLGRDAGHEPTQDRRPQHVWRGTSIAGRRFRPRKLGSRRRGSRGCARQTR